MPLKMKRLNEEEYKETFFAPMKRVEKDSGPPFDFWEYFEQIPETHFQNHDCSSGQVDYAWNDSSGRYQHVLVNSEDQNVFMVLVLDLLSRCVYGHRILDLNKEYGLFEQNKA
jgi:hypothetical protein